MEDKPIYEVPKRGSKRFAFLFAGVGIFLMVGALDGFRSQRGSMLDWALAATGLALIVLAVLRGKRGR